MTGHLDATLRALAFLSRLPPVGRAFHGEHRLGDDAHAFPVAGLLVALPGAALLALAQALGLSAPVAAILSLALTIGLTGALHEDGLADTADGLFGHHPRERALAIMKDSRIGVYGTLALILVLGAKVALLAELLTHGTGAAILALLAAAAASRGAMAHLWSSLPAAEPGGLAARVGAPDARTGRAAIAIGLVVSAAFGALAAGALGLLLPTLAGLCAHLAFRRFVRRRLGGATGDTIGCDQQLVEVAILTGFALAL